MSKTYRADHVGSLLRPKALLEAWDAHERGELAEERLIEVEDQAILEVLKLQRDAGVDVVTDGEFRRLSWLSNLHDAAEGLSRKDEPGYPPFWRGPGETVANAEMPVKAIVCTGKLRAKKRLCDRESAFLGKHAGAPFKTSLASPTMHLNLYAEGVTDKVYPDIQGYVDDIVAIYQDEVDALLADGCSYVQLDTLRYTQIIGAMDFMLNGMSHKQAAEQTLAADNAILARAKAGGATTAIHICRGNHRSAWAASGSYEEIAEDLFSRTEADRLLLEYDDERSGGFEPLRFVPKGKTVVLGLITTKTPQLEDQDLLRRRVDAAAKFVPIEQLAISPQCGFASTHMGNLLSIDEERRKLELVADTARKIWG
jgi:5-methyltetrahydropteroyltriglutamate--homocysteine methyltransferase